MEILSEAMAGERPIKLRSAGVAAVAALVPVKRPDGVAFRLSAERHLRITKMGKTDLNGGKNGPCTVFSASSGDDGTLLLRGVKSGLWLDVHKGEFKSSEEPESLRVELDVIRSSSGEPEMKRLRLADGSAALPWSVQLQQKNRHVLLVTDSGNVACGENGHFHAKGKEGKWAQWVVEQKDAGMSLKNVGHEKYINLNIKGIPELTDEPAFFAAAPAEDSLSLSPNDTETLPPITLPPVDNSVLSPDDVVHFKEKGYVILRDAIPPELVRDALRVINHQLGKPDCWEADPNPLNAAQLTLKLTRDVGTDIFNKSPKFFSAVSVLLGTGNVWPWRHGQQVALRFPQSPEKGHEIADVLPGTRYHIDGMGQNQLCPFSLLCGVALSDQMRPHMGNLHVFPGSHLHHELHQYYVEKINDDGQNEMDPNKPDLGESVQVLLAPGDVVIAHQLLAHRVGRNFSQHIRYQLYYRVSHKKHQKLRQSIIQDPWTEFAI